MQIIGEPYAITITQEASRVVYRSALANGLLVQAQGGNVYYRMDGSLETVTGFVIPQNEVPVKIVIHGQHALTVWTTEKDKQVRIILQEIKEWV